MAAIKINPDEFVDIMVAFLLDKMMEEDVVLPGNEQFDELIDLMTRLGIKPFLLKHYIRSSPVLRNKYKVIRKSFIDRSHRSSIDIAGTADDKKKSSLAGKIKKIIKLVNNSKTRNLGVPLTEEKIDVIIDKVMSEGE